MGMERVYYDIYSGIVQAWFIIMLCVQLHNSSDINCLPALLCLAPVHLSVSLLVPWNQHQLASVIQTGKAKEKRRKRQRIRGKGRGRGGERCEIRRRKVSLTKKC